MELIVGTRAWSSWSLRPWLVLKRLGVPFKETLISLRQADATKAAIAPHSPSGWIPALKDGDLTVWDSLAICEYLAERFPEAALWPKDAAARAIGRSAVAEMHSGFRGVRSELSMTLGETLPTPDLSEDARSDVRRIVALWRDLLARFGGPWLLGSGWTIADAYYAPVATRFRTFGLDLSDFGDDGTAQAWIDRVLAEPDFLLWERLAAEDAA
jgi:glutathione S-transferase